MSRFEVTRRLGSGGFGVVDEAVRVDDDGEQVDGRPVAIKTLDAEHLVDDEALARFVREVRLQHDELDHPNIMPVLARNLSERPPYFVMPLADGNLQEALDDGRAGEREWVVWIFSQILEGMAYAHERDEPVVHRDLKPLNVLFLEGRPVVADFGLGKRLSADATTLTKTDVGMGTEIYMAPEQFTAARDVGPSADVYALGKVLWQMLTGAYPEILHVDLAAVPREFEWFIAKCTAYKPEERFRTAGEALASFNVFTASPGVLDPPLESAEKLVREWAEATEDQRLGVIRRLDEHLRRNAGEEDLFYKVIPRLPDELIDRYAEALPEAFGLMLATYDGHISGGLPFAYCDVVADFYSRLWRTNLDLSLRRLLLARLVALGADHNRWYVGGAVADLLSEIDEVSTAMMAAEVIRADARHAEWFWSPWAKDRPLPQPIADAFADITDATS